METATHAPDSPRQPPTAQQTELHDDEQTHSSRCVNYLTERLSSPQNLRRRSRSPPTASSPPPIPKTPFAHTAMAPSALTHLSTMTEPFTLPHLGPLATARKRRNAPPGPSEHPRNASQPPNSPQRARKRAVSLPTKALNDEHQQLRGNDMATTVPLPRPLCSPTQLRKYSMPPVSPQLSHRKVVSSIPARSVAPGIPEPAAAAILRPCLLF
jgi:hypothetical protein